MKAVYDNKLFSNKFVMIMIDFQAGLLNMISVLMRSIIRYNIV